MIYFNFGEICEDILIITVIHTTYKWNLSLKKNAGLNGIRTHDLCNIGAVLNQLSYWAKWVHLLLFNYIKWTIVRIIPILIVKPNISVVIPHYYMATIVHALWLAAEWALFSCNDRALWIFSQLNGSFELWVKLCARGQKQQKRWTKYNYIFNNWKKKLAYRYFFRMSDEESPSARKRMWKVASGVFIVFFLRIALKRPYNK